jgi:hypothetical protein
MTARLAIPTRLHRRLSAAQPEAATGTEHRDASGGADGGPACYVLRIVPVGAARWSSVPESVRLRRLLKAMLRRYGFRCSSCRRELAP